MEIFQRRSAILSVLSDPIRCGNHVRHRGRNPIAPKHVRAVVDGHRQGSTVASQIGVRFGISVVVSESGPIIVIVVGVVGGGGERFAAEFDEAVEDVVDGAAVDEEGGEGHEGGAEQRGHGEVQRGRERRGGIH